MFLFACFRMCFKSAKDCFFHVLHWGAKKAHVLKRRVFNGRPPNHAVGGLPFEMHPCPLLSHKGDP